MWNNQRRLLMIFWNDDFSLSRVTGAVSGVVNPIKSIVINPPRPRLILSLRSSATNQSFIFPPSPPHFSALCHVLGMELLAVFSRGLGSAAAAAVLVASQRYWM